MTAAGESSSEWSTNWLTDLLTGCDQERELFMVQSRRCLLWTIGINDVDSAAMDECTSNTRQSAVGNEDKKGQEAEKEKTKKKKIKKKFPNTK